MYGRQARGWLLSSCGANKKGKDVDGVEQTETTARKGGGQTEGRHIFLRLATLSILWIICCVFVSLCVQ